jgi:hypothetical protein
MITVDDTEDYEFTFGKYRFCTYAEVLKRDPHYILWLVEEGKFEIPDLDLNELQDACA